MENHVHSFALVCMRVSYNRSKFLVQLEISKRRAMNSVATRDESEDGKRLEGQAVCNSPESHKNRPQIALGSGLLPYERFECGSSDDLHTRTFFMRVRGGAG